MSKKTVSGMIKEAIVDERKGNAFYKELAGKMRDKDDKAMINRIAAQEASHKRKLTGLMRERK